ncbi:MAG: ABC transporter permease [Anaerolineaceae bacterium]
MKNNSLSSRLDLQSKAQQWIEKIRQVSIKDFLTILIAILVAFIIAGILIVVIGINPLEAYREFLRGSLGSKNGIAEVLVRTTPLALAGLGVSIAFRAGIWNIGAEGQIYMGALGATLAGLFLPPMPIWIHLPLAVAAGFIFGATWGAVVGFFKARLGANEVIITIMMNYLATYLVGYLVSDPLKDTSGLIPQPQSAKIPVTAILPKILPATRAHAGILVAVLAVALVFFLLKRTTWGYNFIVLGANREAARYGGIPILITTILVMAFSGGFAGLAGAGEVLGLQHYLTQDISPGYGNLAIAVALFGGLEPVGVALSAFFFGTIMVGAEAMQRAMGVPTSMVYIIQALMIMIVLARRVFRR